MALLGSVADGEDTVVELLTATVGDDTTSVALEGELVGLDGDGDWSLCKGSLELRALRVLFDVLVGLDFTLTKGLVVLAVSILGGVWVLGLELEWARLNVLESIVHETTIAAHVSVLGAVNELLLRVGLEGSGGEEHGSLNGTSGREGPA